MCLLESNDYIYIWFKRIQMKHKQILNLYKIKVMNKLLIFHLFTFASTSNFSLVLLANIKNYQDVPLLTYCKSENDELGK